MAIDVYSTKAICCRCGQAYGTRKSYFPVNHGALYKGLGFIPICKDCIDAMYSSYLTQCGDQSSAARQVCRCLDLYWSEKAFDSVRVRNTNRTIMSSYITKINNISYAGKSYDDTLIEEGNLWNWGTDNVVDVSAQTETDDNASDDYDIPDEVREYWGENYDDKACYYLEKRRNYLLSGFPEGTKVDVGTEGYIKQICALERDIENARAAGKSVDKLVSALDKLYGSAGLKPSQRQDDGLDANMAETPLGVWLLKYENKRPLPEIDDDLKDVNGVRKYVFTWLGHVCKMLGKKNGFSKLYESEIQRLRVEKPEYDDEDDEDMMMDVFGSGEEYDGDIL